MIRSKKALKFWTDVFFVCIFASISVFVLNSVLFSKKDITNNLSRQNLLHNAKRYLLINATDYVSLDTLLEKGYISNNLNNKCNLSLSYIAIINSNYHLFLNCNDRIESLVLAY